MRKVERMARPGTSLFSRVCQVVCLGFIASMLFSQCVIGGDSGTACTKDDDCLGEKRCVSGLCLSFQQAKEYVLPEPSREVSRSEIPVEMSVGEESVVSTDSFSGDAGELISGDRSSDAPGSDTEPLDAVPASFGPSRFGLSAGGGTMKSANYRLRGKIGPSLTQSMQSPGYKMKAVVLWGSP